MHTRPASQLGGEGEVGSHPSAVRDHREGVHHELLLSAKNLQDLGASHFPYMVHVLPRPLPRRSLRVSILFLWTSKVTA